MPFSENTIHLDQELVDEIVERLKKMSPLQIFLFGSQAEGTADADSDIDLLVVKESIVSHMRESIEARKLLRGLGRAFDLIVSTPEEFEFYRHQVNSVHHAVAHYGRRLYG
jgi:predicted nucleotidyltransferase